MAMHPGKHKLLNKSKLIDELAEQLECIKASIEAKVEYPFWACEGELPGYGREHRAVAPAFYAVEPVDNPP